MRLATDEEISLLEKAISTDEAKIENMYSKEDMLKILNDHLLYS